MEATTQYCAMLSTIALGLMSGALLAEGALLVPFWRSLSAMDFLTWYKKHAALLQNFFGPLEIAAAGLTWVTAALAWVNHSALPLFTVAALLCLAILAVFPVYFQRANTSFRTGTIDTDEVADELRRWSHWHWTRTAMSIAAFAAATIAVSR